MRERPSCCRQNFRLAAVLLVRVMGRGQRQRMRSFGFARTRALSVGNGTTATVSFRDRLWLF